MMLGRVMGRGCTLFFALNAMLALLVGCVQSTPPANCSTAPVSGFAFQVCKSMAMPADASGALIRYTMQFADAQSELQVVYFKASGRRSAPVFSAEQTVGFFRSPSGFGPYLDTASNFGPVQTDRNDRFFDFVLNGRRCKGITKFGRQLSSGDIVEYGSVALIVMCRESTVPISIRKRVSTRIS
jgi:hypothetical protein